MQLKPLASSDDDLYAINIFLALISTDMGYPDYAISYYNEIINKGIATSTVYSNLGILYSERGEYDYALACLRLAIQNDENNPAAYNNLANLYFDNFDLENAKINAHKSFELNHKFRPAATLLALIYSIENNSDEAEKYTHIAIANGQNPQALKAEIERYMEMFDENKEDS